MLEHNVAQQANKKTAKQERPARSKEPQIVVTSITHHSHDQGKTKLKSTLKLLQEQ